MIHPIGDIQWLDMKSGDPHDGMLLNLYSMYSEYSYKNNKGNSTIVFMDDLPGIAFPVAPPVKITDWTGWTDLIMIERIDDVPQTAFIQAGNNQLRIHKDALIPCYNTTPIKGFHGETKYLYTVKRLSDIHNEGQHTGELLRTRRTDEEFNELRVICRGDGHNSMPFVYQITTRSGFFNVNNIHMWGRSVIPEDYCAICPSLNNNQCSRCRK